MGCIAPRTSSEEKTTSSSNSLSAPRSHFGGGGHSTKRLTFLLTTLQPQAPIHTKAKDTSRIPGFTRELVRLLSYRSCIYVDVQQRPTGTPLAVLYINT